MENSQNQKQIMDFVGAWQTSNSVREVAGKLGVSESKVANWSCLLRKHKVPLRNFRASAARRYDYKALTEHALSFVRYENKPLSDR